MSLILQVTKAGREQKANARLNNLPLPRFSGFIIDSAVEQNADDPTIQVLYESQAMDVVVVKKIDDVAFGIDSAIPPTSQAGWVRGIGLKTEDGVVYAYARFAEANGGMYKPAGVGIELKLILAEDGRTAVVFTYRTVDVDVLKSEITQAVLEHLNIEQIKSNIIASIVPIVTQQALALLEANIRNIDCAAIANVLKTASVEQGVLWLDCQNIPAPPPASSVSLESGLLTLTIAGDNSINSGVISLTDASDSSQTYAIDQNNLTILEH